MSEGIFQHFEMRFLQLLAGIIARQPKGSRLLRRQCVHGIHHDCLKNRAQPARTELELDGFVHHIVEHIGINFEVYTVHFEKFRVLAYNGIFGLGEDSAQGIAVERLKIGEHRQAADDFGYEAIRTQILRCHKMEQALTVLLANVPGSSNPTTWVFRR